jgi:hypothetical protein
MEWEGNMYERVVEFKYLGVLVTEDNEVSAEISARITPGNRCFHAFIRLL